MNSNASVAEPMPRFRCLTRPPALSIDGFAPPGSRRDFVPRREPHLERHRLCSRHPITIISWGTIAIVSQGTRPRLALWLYYGASDSRRRLHGVHHRLFIRSALSDAGGASANDIIRPTVVMVQCALAKRLIAGDCRTGWNIALLSPDDLGQGAGDQSDNMLAHCNSRQEHRHRIEHRSSLSARNGQDAFGAIHY